jgi:hypothetical protein
MQSALQDIADTALVDLVISRYDVLVFARPMAEPYIHGVCEIQGIMS